MMLDFFRKCLCLLCLVIAQVSFADTFVQYRGQPFTTLDADSLSHPAVTNLSFVMRVRPGVILPNSLFVYDSARKSVANRLATGFPAEELKLTDVIGVTISDGSRTMTPEDHALFVWLNFDGAGRLVKWIIKATPKNRDPLDGKPKSYISTSGGGPNLSMEAGCSGPDCTADAREAGYTQNSLIPAGAYVIASSEEGQWQIINSTGQAPAPPENFPVASLQRSPGELARLQKELAGLTISPADAEECRRMNDAALVAPPKAAPSAADKMAQAAKSKFTDVFGKIRDNLGLPSSMRPAPTAAPPVKRPPKAVGEECIVDKKLAMRAAVKSNAPPPQVVDASETPAAPSLPYSNTKLTRGVRPRTFSVGASDVIAIKNDGNVELRSFKANSLTPTTQRSFSELQNAVSIGAQSTFDAIRIGTISTARMSDGSWLGWQYNSSPVKVAFDSNLAVMDMTHVDAPATDRIVQIAGGLQALWRLYDDGTVLMSSARGLVPNPGTTTYQKAHKFTGVVKVFATAGSNGSTRALMLRSDGTVWENGKTFVQGWVTVPGTEAERAQTRLADPAWSAVQVKGLEHVVDLAIYWPSTSPGKGLALLENGSLLELQLPPSVGSSPNGIDIRPVQTPAKALRIAAGASALGVIDLQGKVWVWGSNPEIRLSDNRPYPGLRGRPISPEQANEPMMVEGINNAIEIEFSSSLAGALLADGTAWIWAGEAPVKIFDNVKLPK